MLQSNQDVMGLSRFILTRLLASPDIAAEFAHPTVPHLYKEGMSILHFLSPIIVLIENSLLLVCLWSCICWFSFFINRVYSLDSELDV